MSEIRTSRSQTRYCYSYFSVLEYWDVKMHVNAKLGLLVVKISILCHINPGKTEENYERLQNNRFTQGYIRIYYHKLLFWLSDIPSFYS